MLVGFPRRKVKILSRDKLAYLLLLNGKDRHAWSSMLVDRMTAKMNVQDQDRRILFYKVIYCCFVRRAGNSFPAYSDELSSSALDTVCNECMKHLYGIGGFQRREMD